MKLKNFGTLLFLLCSLTVGTVFAQTSNSVEGDRQALEDLYHATNGDNWTNNSGWLNGNPSNDWYGIEVDANGRVIRVDLDSNNLSGTLPASIGNLTKVTHFDVEANAMTGDIPDEIGNMTSLIELWLAGRPSESVNLSSGGYHPGKTIEITNSYSGELPQTISNLTNLQIFRLERQGQLTGSLPTDMGNMTSLRAFLMYGEFRDYKSGLTGQIPPGIGGCSNLVIFHIGRQAIEGSLPPEMGNLSKLKALLIGATNISGAIPSSFSGLTSLRFLFATDTMISGEFPHFMFDGTIPWNTFVFDWPREGYGFTGQLPDFSQLTTNIIHFGVLGNKMTGSIPSSITSINPKILNLGWQDEGYGFSGELPQTGWSNYTRIRRLRLIGNNLEGPIPTEMAQMEGDLSSVLFQENKFVPADIIPALEAGFSFGYENQKPFGEATIVTLSAGEAFTIDFTDKSHPDDSYQWEKNGNSIPGETSAILTIDSVTDGDAGIYKLRIANPNISIDHVISEPIEFKIE